MQDIDSKINKLEIEIASLREKVSITSIFYTRLEETIDKLEEMIEDRRTDINNDLRDVYKKIDDTKSDLSSEMRLLREDMNKNMLNLAQNIEQEKKKISDLEKWRWLLVGGAAVLGWIVSKIDLFS